MAAFFSVDMVSTQVFYTLLRGLTTALGVSFGGFSALQEQRLKPSDFEGAILCSVVPYLVATLRESAQRVLGCKPMLITRKLDTGLTLDLPEPEKLEAMETVVSHYTDAKPPIDPAVLARVRLFALDVDELSCKEHV